MQDMLSDDVEVVAGKGIVGDRYANRVGTYSVLRYFQETGGQVNRWQLYHIVLFRSGSQNLVFRNLCLRVSGEMFSPQESRTKSLLGRSGKSWYWEILAGYLSTGSAYCACTTKRSRR